MNILCKLFGHKWIYGNPAGRQEQPTKRVCFRCGKIEDFFGELTWSPGTFGQFWYSDKDWRSEDEQKKFENRQKIQDEKYNQLTGQK